MIHPQAIIEPGAIIGKNVSIGPWSYIANNVVIGDNCEIKSHVVIMVQHVSVKVTVFFNLPVLVKIAKILNMQVSQQN